MKAKIRDLIVKRAQAYPNWGSLFFRVRTRMIFPERAVERCAPEDRARAMEAAVVGRLDGLGLFFDVYALSETLAHAQAPEAWFAAYRQELCSDRSQPLSEGTLAFRETLRVETNLGTYQLHQYQEALFAVGEKGVWSEIGDHGTAFREEDQVFGYVHVAEQRGEAIVALLNVVPPGSMVVLRGLGLGERVARDSNGGEPSKAPPYAMDGLRDLLCAPQPLHAREDPDAEGNWLVPTTVSYDRSSTDAHGSYFGTKWLETRPGLRDDRFKMQPVTVPPTLWLPHLKPSIAGAETALRDAKVRLVFDKPDLKWVGKENE